MVYYGTTALSEAALCLKRYEYHQVDGLVPLPERLSPRIRKGLWAHKALADHDLGLSWADALSECHQWAVDHGVPRVQCDEILDECNNLVAGYLYYWLQPQNNPGWQIVTVEESVHADWPGGFAIAPTVDKIIRDRQGRQWLVELKTTSDIPNATWRAIDPQTALQFAACWKSGKYQPVGIIFDYLLTVPASIPRIRKDGRIYANSLQGETTTAAFDSCISEMTEKWKGDKADIQPYIDQCRLNMVNDAKFYQRFEVLRPGPSVVQALLDARDVTEAIAAAQEKGYYRRLNNILMCQRFCPYNSLCATEFVKGGISESMRKYDYMLEDKNDREAR